MATPRKPGAQRGRPKKLRSSTTSRHRGRPALECIEHDPDRYSVALAEALLAIGDARGWFHSWVLTDEDKQHRRTHEFSERAAYFHAAALSLSEVAPPDATGKVVLQKRYASGLPASIEGFASTLRQKGAKYRGCEWLEHITAAFIVALTRPPHRDSKADVLALAAAVGEGEFARKALFAMVDCAP